jgi:hypothetical protein
MKLRTVKQPCPVRTFRPEVLRLEDRLVPGEVLGAALLGAMGPFTYPALVAQDSPGDDGPSAAPSSTAASDTRSDDASDPLTLCQGDGLGYDLYQGREAVAPSSSQDAQDPAPTTGVNDPASPGMTAFFGGTLDAQPLPDRPTGGLPPSASSPAAPGVLASAGASLLNALEVSPAWSAPAGLGALPPTSTAKAVSAAPPAAASTPVPSDASGGAAAAGASPAQADASGGSADSAGGYAEPLLVFHRTSSPGAKPDLGPPPSYGPYTPAQIRHAYGIDLLANQGRGQTIYIIDAFKPVGGVTTLTNDLHTFDARFGLPDPTFTVHKMATPISANSGWGLEESLDVQWAHAIAPQANITLVMAQNSSNAALFGAVQWATNNGAHIVSMSWGNGDLPGESSNDSYFNHAGVTYIASAGDTGGVVSYPSASPYVLSVGGTNLQIDNNNNYVSESAWSAGGGGPSLYEPEPAYQTLFGIVQVGRATPDVSFDADPNTGVYVVDGGVWYQVGGTSLSAPAWAGIIALADQGRTTPLSTSSLTSSTEYNAATGSVYATNYHDVTTGSNGYPAGVGYDLATGLGSPQANNLVPWLTNHS